MATNAKRKGKKVVEAPVVNTQLDVAFHFPSPIYLIERPDFLKTVLEVSEESLAIQHQDRKLDEIYPVYMSANLYDDSRIKTFAEFVGATAWNILNEQGYAMQDKVVTFTYLFKRKDLTSKLNTFNG